jgi:hypothetical protein
MDSGQKDEGGPEALGGLHTLMFSRLGGAIAAVGLTVSILMPAEGIGVDLCGFLKLTGLPCPGCGLTRSVTNITHGNLGAAWHYNPFGFFVWATFAALAPCLVLPGRALRKVRGIVEPAAGWINGLVYTCLGCLLVYGVVRVVHHWIIDVQFPAAP